MKRELFENLLKLGLVAAVITIACPDVALAQALKNSVEEVKGGISQMPTLVSGFAYIAGGAAMLSGAGMLKKHADNPQQNPLAPGVARMALGGVVAAMPSFLSYVNGTLKSNTEGPLKYQGLDKVGDLNLIQQITNLFT